MSAPKVSWEVSPELAASVQRMRQRDDYEALQWEHGLKQTRPAIRPKVASSTGILSRFLPRKHRRLILSNPQRQAARERRRQFGGSGDLPPTVRRDFTLGEMAVLAVVGGDVKHHGVCEMPNDRIAAIAGVGKTTVQNALHEARRLGLIEITERPQPGRRNLPNVIKIISREWLAWIKRGPTAHRPNRAQISKKVSPNTITDLRRRGSSSNDERQKGAFRGVQVAGLSP